MSDMRSILVDSATRLFTDLCTRERFDAAEKGALDSAAWSLLEAAGLPRATVPEALGGTGADLGDALMLVREAGRFALPLPLMDTLLAQWVLAQAALPGRNGIGAVGPAAQASLTGDKASAGMLRLERSNGRWSLSGTLHRVPWARHANFLAVVADCGNGQVTAAIPETVLRKARLREDRNWANEPRDSLDFDTVVLPDDCVGAEGAGFNADELRLQGALFRLCAMGGALNQVLKLSVQYAQERSQFGRAIGQFQAIQHGLAVMASQSAAANAAVDATVDAVSRGAAHFEIAAAKARIGEAAHIACGIAHQVHGAMGFTQEHALHRFTRRLWAWRDEFGTELDWAEWVGREAVRLGSAGLWPFLTSMDRMAPTEAGAGRS